MMISCSFASYTTEKEKVRLHISQLARYSHKFTHTIIFDLSRERDTATCILKDIEKNHLLNVDCSNEYRCLVEEETINIASLYLFGQWYRYRCWLISIR